MSDTPNLDLKRPAKGESIPAWYSSLNDNFTKLDTAYGNVNASIADLPEVYVLTGTFNSTSGDVIDLPKAVSAINEYSVGVMATSRGSAIGDIYISKTTTNFTVYCSESNTTDTFAAVVHYIGDINSYGGSIYRRWYVSTDPSITDQGDQADTGSLGWVLAQIGSSPATIELPGNKTYVLQTSVTINNNIELIPQMGAILKDDTNNADLTINGAVKAGPFQWIDWGNGSGTLQFGQAKIEKAYPQWTGAVGDGSTDDATAINNLADACRLNAIPIHFPPGDYYTTVSLNFSGANNDNVGYHMGWTISGAGPEATQITGNLSSAYPIVDMSDDQECMIKDIRIQGHASGNQICGLLHAQVGAGLALNNRIFNVNIAGTYSEMGYINSGSDLTRIHNSYIYGPSGVLFTSTSNALGAGIIDSAYNSLVAVGNSTHQSIVDCEIIGIGGDSNGWDSAIVCDEVYRVSILSTYIAQDVVAKAGILISGDTGTAYDSHAIEFISSRYENQTDTPDDGRFIWITSPDGLRDSIIQGFVGGNGNLPDNGEIFYLDGGNLFNTRIKIQTGAVNDWAHFVQRSGSEEITNCQIYEQQGDGQLLNGLDAAIFGIGNVFHLRAWDSSWLNVGDSNIFFTDDSGMVIVNSSTGLHTIGATTSVARIYTGSVTTDWLLAQTTAAAGDETLGSYTVPGDIGRSNTAQNRNTLRIKAFGFVAANANAKSIEGKFGISGSETQIITNDVTGSPNNAQWEITAEICRVNSTTGWRYCCTMTVGSVTQTTKTGGISADPDVDTVKFLLTGNASAGDITLDVFKVEIF